MFIHSISCTVFDLCCITQPHSIFYLGDKLKTDFFHPIRPCNSWETQSLYPYRITVLRIHESFVNKQCVFRLFTMITLHMCVNMMTNVGIWQTCVEILRAKRVMMFMTPLTCWNTWSISIPACRKSGESLISVTSVLHSTRYSPCSVQQNDKICPSCIHI